MEYSGLTSGEAQTILKTSGSNEIPEPKGKKLKKFLSWFATPIALMLLVAALLSLCLSRTFDFYLITALALTGLFMPSKIPFVWVIVVWVWSFFWMQISELPKVFIGLKN